MTIEEIIRKEMTPSKVRFWGHDYENFTPTLAETALGDGQRLMFFTPLSTRPYYYIIRIDSKLPNLEDDEGYDEFVEEVIEALEEEFDYLREEDEEGNEIEDDRDFPVLRVNGGFTFGFFDENGNIVD